LKERGADVKQARQIDKRHNERQKKRGIEEKEKT
jgi:hypothetical protein